MAGTLGEVSGEGPDRAFISFPGVPFNTLVHQNVWIQGSGLFRLVLFLKNVIKHVIEKEPGLRPSCSQGTLGSVTRLLRSVLGQGR